MAVLQSIVYRPLDTPQPASGYLRVPLTETTLVAGVGIEGDAKGGGRRQLNIMTAAAATELASEGFHTAPGQLGEQLMVSGLDVNILPRGARLTIGPDAIIEIVEPRTGCGKLERHQGKRKEEAAGRLGMMAIVVASGRIRVGDSVERAEADMEMLPGL